jgi:hypothetical protein
MDSLKEKSDEKKIYDLKKITIPHFNVNTETKSKILLGDRLFINQKIYGKIIPFFYLHEDLIKIRGEYFYNGNFRSRQSIFKYNNEYNDVIKYINDIKENLSIVLGFSKKQRLLQMSIDYVERPETDQIRIDLPSYNRLKRIKVLHNNVLDLILEILHNFYWLDFENCKSNSRPLEYYINIIIPIIIELVDSFEEEIYNEYPENFVEKEVKVKLK